MKILILGGTGNISREITKQALEAGHEVTIFNRGSRKLDFGGDVRAVTGDRNDSDDFLAKMKKENHDIVIDMICFTPDDAKQTLEAFSGRTGQIIVTSSVAVYARPYKSFPTREECEGYIEDTGYLYGYNKAQMEKYLRSQMGEGKTPITIIRPSLTFGPGGMNMGVLRQNYNIIHRIKQGKPLLLFGDGTALWSFTFSPDLARAYIMSCGNKNTYNDYFGVSNSSLGIWKDLYLTIARLVGKDASFAYAPASALCNADPDLFGHLEFEKKYATVYDCEKFKKAVPGFEFSISLEKGLENQMAWWESQGNPVDDMKNRLEDVLCGECAAFETRLRDAVQGL